MVKNNSRSSALRVPLCGRAPEILDAVWMLDGGGCPTAFVVTAWALEDEPTDEQVEAVVDAFEKTAWAGLELDRYAWAAVLHREEGMISTADDYVVFCQMFLNGWGLTGASGSSRRTRQRS